MRPALHCTENADAWTVEVTPSGPDRELVPEPEPEARSPNPQPRALSTPPRIYQEACNSFVRVPLAKSDWRRPRPHKVGSSGHLPPRSVLKSETWQRWAVVTGVKPLTVLQSTLASPSVAIYLQPKRWRRGRAQEMPPKGGT